MFILGAASAAIAACLSSAIDVLHIDGLPHMGRTRYPKGWDSSGRGFHPRINRNTGRPHEHKREISRRLRQMAATA